MVILFVQGQLDFLLTNPNYKHLFTEWGLRPETAFGCAFHFLFRPTQAVADSVAVPLNALGFSPRAENPAPVSGHPLSNLTLSQKPKRISIAIHIRMGDEFMNASNICPYGPCDAETSMFFKCAEVSNWKHAHQY